MTTTDSCQIFYVNLTPEEQDKLELIDGSVATLCLSRSTAKFSPIWIGHDNDGNRMIRLIASGLQPSTLFELTASDVIKLPPSALYLLIAEGMRRH